MDELNYPGLRFKRREASWRESAKSRSLHRLQTELRGNLTWIGDCILAAPRNAGEQA